MPATEDSVLTSLDELRRLRKERRKKGHAAGGAGGNGRSQKRAAAAHDPMGDQVTPPPRSDLAQGAKAMRAGLQPAMGGPAWASSAGHAPAAQAATWDAPVDPMALARMARPTSSAKPAIVVAVLLLAAAGIGYLKLQSDTQAILADKDASIRRVEDARAQAVEAAAKAERQAQAKLKACEAKAVPTAPGTTAAASVAPAATAAVAPASSVSYPPASSRGRHRSSGRHAAAAPSVPAPSAAPNAVPQLPRKRKLDNDPLAGIKI